jgi:hypothetical protein
MSHRKHLDFVTGNCGVSLPTLLARIGSMAAHGRTPPTRFPAVRVQRAWRAELAQHTGSPHEGPAVPARPPEKTTATAIASGPADRPAAAIRMKVAKRFSGPSMNHRAAPPADGPAVRRACPSCRLFRREPMTARAGPID